jgi:succinate dehydrogenase/fumarate reductase-like Fe-S protein
MATEDLATVELSRFDPGADAAPRFSTFRVAYQGCTVMIVLRRIYETLDSTFAFRWACGKGGCRSCVLCVNGRRVLACTEPASAHMRIEPHPKYHVLKDLLIDFERPK